MQGKWIEFPVHKTEHEHCISKDRSSEILAKLNATVPGKNRKCSRVLQFNFVAVSLLFFEFHNLQIAQGFIFLKPWLCSHLLSLSSCFSFLPGVANSLQVWCLLSAGEGRNGRRSSSVRKDPSSSVALMFVLSISRSHLCDFPLNSLPPGLFLTSLKLAS